MFKMPAYLSLILVFGLSCFAFAENDLDGLWDGELESPGGALCFGLKIQTSDGVTNAYLINGPETIKIPSAIVKDDGLILDISHYDSKLVLQLSDDHQSLTGFWQKTRGKDNAPKMIASLNRHRERTSDEVKSFLGTWAVDFSSSDDPAVAIIRGVENDSTKCSATFRTTTGDYRYLGGTVVDGQLRLSVFDGGHAFLFLARLNEQGELEGDFWSSLNWHETWTAQLDAEAEMPDAFQETTWQPADLGDFQFPNLAGEPTSLNDPKFTGRPRLVHVFGSWCPNCHDAGIYLGELKKKYGDDLSVLGLAFELTGDFERDVKQVKLFHQRHDTDYPVLIAGLSDKKLASKAIPFLDRVRSYPTTVFIDAKGEVVGIHTGFNGPATGEAYETLKQEFESRIDQMIKSWKSSTR